MIVVAAGIQVGAWLLGMILYPGFPDERKKVLQYATICSNAGILGNPIAEGIFGSMGLLYASIYTIPQRTFMWSIGLTYFTQAPDMKTLIKKVSTHPCIVSVVIGMLIMVFQIPVQGFLSLTIKNIAGGNTFLAMSLVGTILAEVPFRSLPEKDTVYYSFIRLFFIPFLVYLACHFAQVDSLVTGVSVLAVGDGEVVVAKRSGAAGYYVAIRHGRTYTTRYMHLRKLLVKPGQKVKRGDRIALSGNTGRSTGPHLHYEVWINQQAVNPLTAKLPRTEGLSGSDRTDYLAQVKEVVPQLRFD